jgi:ABC-type uncharacterized transport system permease subunit
MLPSGWDVTLVSAALSFAVPLLLAGVGECIAERAGILNIGVEGMMLAGALAAVAVSHRTGSAWLGLGAAALSAAALGAAFGVLTVYRNCDQVVSGTVLNLLAGGLTGALYFTLTKRLAEQHVSRLVGIKLPDWPIPGLSGIPALGPTLFRGNLLVYLAFLLVPAVAFFLFRTRPGLQLRACGEYPEAAEAAGVRVRQVRVAAVTAGGLLAGLAGAFLSIGHVVTFAENMTAGKGFIALALVIFGRWHPAGVLVGAAVFSLAWGLGAVFSSQGRGRPEEVILLALPYLATLAALLFRPQRTTAPAALARTYARS